MNVGNTLVLNGTISANGTSGPGENSGGGSGGSIWLTVNFISGSGTISANGGNGTLPYGGGGGGGRIALYNNKLNTFAGTLRGQRRSRHKLWWRGHHLSSRQQFPPVGASTHADN